MTACVCELATHPTCASIACKQTSTAHSTRTERLLSSTRSSPSCPRRNLLPSPSPSVPMSGARPQRPAGAGAPRAAGPPRAGAPRPSQPRGPAGTSSNGRYAPAGSDIEAGAANPNRSIEDVNAKLGEVRTVMTENMKKAIDRGDQLEAIEEKSDVLLADSTRFQNSAAATKQMYCRRHWRNILLISFLATLVLVLILWWSGAFNSSSSD